MGDIISFAKGRKPNRNDSKELTYGEILCRTLILVAKDFDAFMALGSYCVFAEPILDSIIINRLIKIGFIDAETKTVFPFVEKTIREILDDTSYKKAINYY